MRRAAIVLLAVVLGGCQWRSVEREVVVVDGERFLCSRTVNGISGNETQGHCELIPEVQP